MTACMHEPVLTSLDTVAGLHRTRTCEHSADRRRRTPPTHCMYRYRARGAPRTTATPICHLPGAGASAS